MRAWQKITFALLVAPVIAVAAGVSYAQTAQKFPTRPIRIIVPFTAGSASDLIARRLGAKMSEQWGQQVVVDNRGGAGGVVGMGIVASAAPNGYTLLVHSLGFAVSAALYSKLPFDPLRDFAPVSQIMASPSVIVVAPALGVRNVNELIALAKKKPGQINFATAGIGSGTHLNAEQFRFAAGIDVAHVPYKGPSEALLETMTGRVQYFISPLVPALPLIREGTVLALAVTTAQRTPMLPDVPTVAEAGLPGFEISGWYGIFAPSQTPAPVVAKLSAEIDRLLATPDVRASLAKIGVNVLGGSAAQFAAYIKREDAKWSKAIRDAGVRVE